MAVLYQALTEIAVATFFVGISIHKFVPKHTWLIALLIVFFMDDLATHYFHFKFRGIFEMFYDFVRNLKLTKQLKDYFFFEYQGLGYKFDIIRLGLFLVIIGLIANNVKSK